MLDMTKILNKFGTGYYLSQNAEDIYSSFNKLLDGEVPNSVSVSLFGYDPLPAHIRALVPKNPKARPDLGDQMRILDNIDFQSLMASDQLPLDGGEELISSSNEVIVYPGADMPTLDTHQEGQNSNPSNENEARRRKNIPFTIEEVEALVRGVRKHGRGSWKKIKDEAFGNDNRRTRTDLRDKWDNLVRTADTPAHRRRGAAPPEWLLEIVRHVENGMQIPPASHAAV
ncbi:hypothetical protein RHMOL_Rhmol13G0098900 [Rhododendron molle]|uniref:Uncharacterized protein n=1 Tax=Rhododendron molle TaxID=49168 RepID=A0ACC0L6D8_RHOML|nr:hypothetical protein RHMOL_Rhmol13G0098900 [Rhododendron molle]